MSKPAHLSKHLVLRDLIDGLPVNPASERTRYFTARLANVISDLRKDGLQFIEDAREDSPHSWYKPFVIVKSETNLQQAKELLERYSTTAIKSFCEKR